MIVQKTTVFPADRDTVFQKLMEFETLQYIASPYASFEPVGDVADRWSAGSTTFYRFHLFGIISFGTHTIHVMRFDPERVSSREYNERVPVWNHDILIEPVDAVHTRYTDRVEIQAGWKTLVIWLWANLFYAHRQRKWIKLLLEEI